MHATIEFSKYFYGQKYHCEKHTVLISFSGGRGYFLSPSGRLERIKSIDYDGRVEEVELLYNPSGKMVLRSAQCPFNKENCKLLRFKKEHGSETCVEAFWGMCENGDLYEPQSSAKNELKEEV